MVSNDTIRRLLNTQTKRTEIDKDLKNQLKQISLSYEAANILDQARALSRVKKVKNYSAILEARNPKEWAERALLFQGKQYSFDGAGLWVASGEGLNPGPLMDNSLIQSIVKPRQIFATTYALVRLGYYLCIQKFPRAEVHWYLHDHSAAEDMSKTRLQLELIDNCEILKRSQIDRNSHRKTFYIDGVERIAYVMATRSSKLGEAGQKAISKTPTYVCIDEYQRHSPYAESYIMGGTGFRNVQLLRQGTPLAPGNHLSSVVNDGTQYMAAYGCPHCGAWVFPDISIDETTREPSSASVITNKSWDGRPDNIRCDNCDYPHNPCKHKDFRCRELIFVCDKCGGSLEHLRGRHGIFSDDGIGTRRGACLWESQRSASDKKPMGASWLFTRFDVAYYSLAKVYQNIRRSIQAGGVRLATNEDIGKTYKGSEGALIQRHWIKACFVRTLSKYQAQWQQYIIRVAVVDWGIEVGAGTWVCVFGLYVVNGVYKWAWLDAESFSGDHYEQRQRAARFVKEKGANIAICDYGAKGGGEKHLQEAIGKDYVFLVNHNLQRNQVHNQDWSISPFDMLGTENIIRIPKANAFDNLVEKLSRYNDPILAIPYNLPYEFDRYIEHLYNIYRGDVNEAMRMATSGFEGLRDEHDAFKKAGPIHIADCFKFLFLTMLTDDHLRFFISRGQSNKQ